MVSLFAEFAAVAAYLTSRPNLCYCIGREARLAEYNVERTQVVTVIRSRSIYRPRLTLRGHANTVYSLAFVDEPGHYLASGSYDQTVRLWDLLDGRLTQTLYGHAGSVSCLAISPRRHWLATGSNDQRVRCWQLAMLALLRRLLAIQRLNLEVSNGAIYSVGFTPDERWLISGGTDNIVRLFDLTHAHAPAIALRSHTGHVYQVAVSPGARWLASASMDNTIALWDLRRVLARLPTVPLVTLHGHTDGVTSVAFSPDGKRLASGSYDGTIKLWDLSLLPYDLTTLRYAVPVTLRGHNDCVQCIVFAPDGKRLASAASDYTVRLWRVDSAHPYEVATLRGHSDKVHTVAFSGDGAQLASGGKDRAVIVWDAVG